MKPKEKGFYLYILKNKLAILLIIALLTGVGYKLSFTIAKGVLPNIFFVLLYFCTEQSILWVLLRHLNWLK